MKIFYVKIWLTDGSEHQLYIPAGGIIEAHAASIKKVRELVPNCHGQVVELKFLGNLDQ